MQPQQVVSRGWIRPSCFSQPDPTTDFIQGSVSPTDTFRLPPLNRVQQQRRVGFADTQTSMLPRELGSAMCVQNLDDSRGLAVRITYRISLRSSSLWEPRHPLLKVVFSCNTTLACATDHTAQCAAGHRFQIYGDSSNLPPLQGTELARFRSIQVIKKV